MAATRPLTSSDRLPVLDGIRGLAIFMIMQYHFWGLGFGFVERPPRLGIDRWITALRDFGWTSVDLFFVLSGFLITGILIDGKAASNHYFRNFYARRFLRIFPLYYVFLVFVLVILARIHPLATYASIPEIRSQQLWFWTYLVNLAACIPAFGAQIPAIYTHFWTLALEEQFYLVWPLVVFALDRRWLRALCCCMIPAALCLRFAIVQGLFSSLLYPNAAHVLTPARMDTLALGALVALAARDERALLLLARWAPYVAGACAACLGLFFLWRGGLPLFDHASLTLGFSIVPIMWAAVLVLAITSPDRWLSRFLANPVLTMFGRYSYCMYVVHLLVGFGVAIFGIKWQLVRTFAGSQVPVNLIVSTVATTACLAIAVASWHLFEKQFLRLKVFFPYEGGVTSSPTRQTGSPVQGTSVAAGG